MKRLWHKVVVVVAILVVMVLLVVLLPGCAGAPQVTAPKEIVLGNTLLLTGPGAAFGQGMAFGLKAGVEDINKLGGIYIKEYSRKLPVRVVILDNESDPVKAGTLAEDLVLKEKINFFVTSGWPPLSAAMANVAEKYKIPNVCFPGPFEPFDALRQAAGGWKHTWISGFALGTPAEKGYWAEGKAGYTMMDLWLGFMGQFINQTNKKVGVFASDDADGRGWYGGFPGALKGLGMDIELVGLQKELGVAPMDTTDFTSIIREWKDNNVEILIGNAPAPWFGTMMRQAASLQFKPNIIIAERAAMFYADIVSWGGDLPWGVTAVVEWLPTIKASGIGDTTPVSLDARWKAASGQPTHMLVGGTYAQVQILADAIERAGTLKADAVTGALAKTDLMTIRGRNVYDSHQFARWPVCFGQWFKTDSAQKWEFKVIFSQHDFYPTTAKPIFPIP